MKTQRGLFLPACMFLMAAAFPADKADDEWKGLTGKWQATKMKVDGNVLPPEQVMEFSAVISEGKYVAKRNDDTIDEGTVTLDPAKKPKEMDVKATVGDNKGKSRKAIYELKGDILKFVIAPPDRDRPTKLDSPRGEMLIYFEYKRVK